MRCSLGNFPNRGSVLASDWLTGWAVYRVGRCGLGGQSCAGFCRDQTCVNMLGHSRFKFIDGGIVILLNTTRIMLDHGDIV